MSYKAKKKLHDYEVGDIIPSENFTMYFNQDMLLKLGLIEKVDTFTEMYDSLVKKVADECDSIYDFDIPSIVRVNGFYMDRDKFRNDVIIEIKKRSASNG